MAGRGETPRRKAWPFAVVAVLFFAAAVLSVLDGSYWLALFQACATGTFALAASGANERGGVSAALVWVLLGVSILALVGVAAS